MCDLTGTRENLMDEMERKGLSFGYTDPVARLLILGAPKCGPHPWDDYTALGFDAGQVPELVRMVSDERLNNAQSDSTEVWAPLHAWRTLAQLRAEEAIEPILALAHRIDGEDDDWINEDLPGVMGLIGPAAIPSLEAYLKNTSNGEWARVAVIECFTAIGTQYPETRLNCVAVLTRQLECLDENGEEVNSFLVSALADLNAVESAPVMERAFAEHAVDFSLRGDWEEVQIDMGLLKERITPRPRTWFDFGDASTVRAGGKQHYPVQNVKSGGKKKGKKAQKQARKKNRHK